MTFALSRVGKFEVISIYSDGSTLRWENGKTEHITRGDDRSGGFWSSGGKSGPQPETGGECLAILNNVYNDGVKWHDVGCNHEKPIVCEDVEGHLNFARQTFPNIRIP